MIVISGALVLVALVLLVIGLIGPSLGFVYASIAASLAAFAFLVVGILQRRKEEPALGGAPGSAAEIAAAIRTPETSPVSAEELAAAGGPSGDVLVVEGRPRYHVAGCRYLAGKDAKTVPAATARAEGYSACGVCKPDDALSSQAAADTSVAPAEAAAPAEEAVPAVAADEGVTVTRTTARTATKTTRAAARPTKSAPAKAATKRATKAAPAKATKTAAKAAKAPAKAAKTAAKATKAPAKATKAPAKAAAKKAPAKKAAKAPAKSTRSRG